MGQAYNPSDSGYWPPWCRLRARLIFRWGLFSASAKARRIPPFMEDATIPRRSRKRKPIIRGPRPFFRHSGGEAEIVCLPIISQTGTDVYRGEARERDSGNGNRAIGFTKQLCELARLVDAEPCVASGRRLIEPR